MTSYNFVACIKESILGSPIIQNVVLTIYLFEIPNHFATITSSEIPVKVFLCYIYENYIVICCLFANIWNMLLLYKYVLQKKSITVNKHYMVKNIVIIHKNNNNFMFF